MARELQEVAGGPARLPGANDDALLIARFTRDGTAVWYQREVSSDDELALAIAPVGGGGLLSGVAIAAEGRRVFAAEPLGADDAARSKAAGRFIPQTAPNTIADGLLTSLGELTWPIVRDRVERIFTVTDDQIRAAMRLVWERMKLIVEPSGAVGLAAILTDEFQAVSGTNRVGIIFSGGNVNLDAFFSPS